MAWTYDEDTQVYTVPFEELESLLQSLPVNTVDTAYKLNITELTVANIDSSLEGNKLGDLLVRYFNYFVDLSYTYIPDGVSDMSGCFSKCTSLTTAPIIPDSVTNMYDCFSSCRSLTTVPIIPDSVTNMHACFAVCTSLTTVPIIPDSVTDMSNCFASCTSLTTAPIIPDSVTNMHACFSKCTSLTTAPIIPDSVTDMSNCFLECTSLTTVPIIPDSVTDMYVCFARCTSLKEIGFWGDASSITSYEGAFSGCYSLEKVITTNCGTEAQLYDFLNNNKTNLSLPSSINLTTLITPLDSSIPFPNLDAYLKYKGVNTPDSPYSLKVTELTVDDIKPYDSTGSLGYVIKANETKYIDISSTELPDSVTDMLFCFGYCKSLVKAPSIPDSVTDIRCCFYGCESLTEAPSIPNSVVIMGNCFNGCISLVSAPIIPDSVTEMWGCFYECTSLVNAPAIPDSVIDMHLCFSNCESLLTAPVIPSSVTNVGSCFGGCTSLVNAPAIPDSVIDMNGCFLGCTSLTEVLYISKNAIDMGSCFYGCTSLIKVGTIPSTTKTLSFCFADCTSLTEIGLWDNCDNITSYVSMFRGCSALETINTSNYYTESCIEDFLNQNKSSMDVTFDVEEVVKPLTNEVPYPHFEDYLSHVKENTVDTPYRINITEMDENSTLADKMARHHIFLDLRDTALPSKENYDEFFYMADKLVYPPMLPEGIISAREMFNSCGELKIAPVLPNSLVDMSGMFDSTGLEEMPDIPGNVEDMSYAFLSCQRITSGKRIPLSVKNMEECFAHCSNLVEADIGNNVENMNGIFFASGLEVIPTIPSTVTSMQAAFGSCKKLTEGIKSPNRIPDGVKSLWELYKDCSGITSLESIPGGKESYKSICEGCTSLETVNNFGLTYEDMLDNSINTMGMFNGCTNLKNVYIPKPDMVDDNKWHMVRIESENKSYKVYNVDGNVEFTGTYTTDDYEKMVIDGKVDELVIASKSAIDDETVEKFFRYRKLFSSDKANLLDPADSNFVLWAKNPDAVKSNFLNGGGGGDATVKDFTQEEYDALSQSEKMDGKFRNITDAEQPYLQINNLYEAQPIGAICTFAGTKDKIPNGYLLCDGSSYSKSVYEDLYAVIGNKYGEDGDNFKVPNLTDRFVQGATDSNFGTTKEAGLPNITGVLNRVLCSGSGAFSPVANSGDYNINASSGSISGTKHNVDFNASRSSSIYGKSSTVQPPSICLYYIIKAYMTDNKTPEEIVVDDTKATPLNIYTAEKVEKEIKSSCGMIDMFSLDFSKVQDISTPFTPTTNGIIIVSCVWNGVQHCDVTTSGINLIHQWTEKSSGCEWCPAQKGVTYSIQGQTRRFVPIKE